MHLVLLGPPASGKGTLAQLLSAKTGAVSVSTGVMLRKAVEENSALGQKAAPYLAQSALVPDEIVWGIIAEWLECHRDHSWILDGFPRTLSQAQQLSLALAESGQAFDAAIELVVDKEELLRRIGLRVQCSACGHTASKAELSPPGLCPKCGGGMASRLDDDAVRFERRYQDFMDQTGPVITYYEGRNELVKVKAQGEPEDVCDALIQTLASRNQG